MKKNFSTYFLAVTFGHRRVLSMPIELKLCMLFFMNQNVFMRYDLLDEDKQTVLLVSCVGHT